MSLIGPRPEDPRFVTRFAAEYDDILKVRPGISGWTQLAFAEGDDLRCDALLRHYVESILPQKIALDHLYAAAPSLGHDAAIATATVRVMLLRQPIAVDRRTGALTRRRRPATHPLVAEADAVPVAGAVSHVISDQPNAASVAAVAPIK